MALIVKFSFLAASIGQAAADRILAAVEQTTAEAFRCRRHHAILGSLGHINVA